MNEFPMKRTLILPLLLALIVGPISQIEAAEAGCGNKIQGGVGGTGSNTPLKLTLTVPPASKGDPVVPYTGNRNTRRSTTCKYGGPWEGFR
jgi:hypothetical protein